MSKTFDELPLKARQICALLVREGAMTEQRYLELWNNGGKGATDAERKASMLAMFPVLREAAHV